MKKFRDFESAREFVRKLNFKNREEWREYCKSGNKPDDIPTDPSQTYKKDFKGVGDWLGTGAIAPKNRTYRSFTDAKKFVQLLGLKNYNDWEKYCASGNKPYDIPSNPWVTYKEWKRK